MALTLYDILSNLLKEDVSSNEVLDAINGKYHVRIRYDDGMPSNEGNPKGSRVIQPMALGTTKKGYPVVRAFQVSGNSRRGAPKWKFFRLDRVTSWKPMPNKKFYSEPPSEYGQYNRTGDRTMGTFTDNAKFGDMSDPLERARAERQNMVNLPKISTKNMQGPINATQQWKKNVFTSQPNSKKYTQFAKNVDQTQNKGTDYWADYDKAMQQALNTAPRPDERESGPIDNEYDVNDVDFNENDFIRNRNTR